MSHKPKKHKTKQMLVSAAIAGLVSFSSSALTKSKHAENVKESAGSFKCHGGNACRGQGECPGVYKAGPKKGKYHACGGKNECRGNGFVYTLGKKECKKLLEKMNKPNGTTSEIMDNNDFRDIEARRSRRNKIRY